MPSHPVKNSYGNIFLFYYSIKKNARASVNLTQSTDARAFVLYILCVTIVFSFCSLNEISNKYAKKEYRCHKSGFLMKKRSGMMQLFLPGYTQWRIFVNPPWSINRRRYNHITTNKYSHHHIRCGCHRHLFLGWSIFWMFLCEFWFKQYIFYGAFMHQITSIFDTEFVPCFNTRQRVASIKNTRTEARESIEQSIDCKRSSKLADRIFYL